MSKFLICECCNQTYLEEDMSKNNKNMCCSCWCYTRPKDKRISELEEQLQGCIRPKFNRQEHIYCVAFGEIREFIVVAYLDNNTTLCEDTTTSRLEWCDNDFLVLTKEEAQAKLQELKGK